MRKRLKKFLSLALALTLCASLWVPASAAEDPNVIQVNDQSDFGEVKDFSQKIVLTSGKTYQLAQDVTLTKSELVIPDGGVVTLDLNGHRLTINSGYGLSIYGDTLTLTDSSSEKTGNIWRPLHHHDFQISCRFLIIEGGTYPHVLISGYTDGEVTIKDAAFSGTFGVTSNEEGAGYSLTIESGSFQEAASARGAKAVTILSGTFASGMTFQETEKVAVSGGTFSAPLQEEVLADGYACIMVDNDVFTVQPGTVPKTPTVTTAYDMTARQTFATLASDADSKIYYSFDLPLGLWGDYSRYAEYTEPLSIAKGGTLRAFAKNSETSSISDLMEEYVQPLAPDAPIVTPAPGTYPGSVTVTITAEEGGKIWYFIHPDDIDSGPAGTQTMQQEYTGPFTLTSSGTVMAYAVYGDQYSKYAECHYTITPASGGGSSSSDDDDDDGWNGGVAVSGGSSKVTDKNGTTTETTTEKNGTKKVVVTKKNGDKTTTITQKNGTKTTLTENVGEPMEATVALASVTTAGQRVTVPVTVDTDRAEVTFTGVTKPIKAVVPVEGIGAGTVAVVDGVISKTAVPEGKNLIVPLEGNATVVIRDNSKSFGDVPGSFWANGAVAFVTSRELFNGTGGGAFTPDAAMSRQMLMTVLARLDGADTSASPYAQGMAWAKSKGISDGSNPTANISREQLAVMLYRYAGSPVVSGSTLGNRFSDAGSVGEYAQAAMEWAVQNGIVTGKTGGVLDPKGQATRAQVAVMLQRYIVSMA